MSMIQVAAAAPLIERSGGLVVKEAVGKAVHDALVEASEAAASPAETLSDAYHLPPKEDA